MPSSRSSRAGCFQIGAVVCWTWTTLRPYHQASTEKAGLPWYGWQAYCRGLASNLKALGIDDMVIQRVLRYSDVSTTQRNYIHVRDEKMHDAMLQLDLAFDACTALIPQKDTPQSVN